MKGLKTVLFYILGLVALVGASLIFTGQGEESPAKAETQTGANIVALAGQERSDCVPSAMSMSYVYIPGAPFTTTLAPLDLEGERLIVSGTVFALDGVTPLPRSVVEVWQAGADGQYENLRAQMVTDALGHYQYNTVKPGYYQVDCQQLPAHIHYRVTYLDHQPLFTLLFFQDDPYLANASIVNPNHIRPLATLAGADGPYLHTTFDLILPVTIDPQR